MKETPKHLLITCPELGLARQKLKAQLKTTRLSLELLLHSKLGIEKTLQFLKETGVGTRKWHLNRWPEEGEEEVEEESRD